MKNLEGLNPVVRYSKILGLEAQAIHRAVENLQPKQVEKALNLLSNCQGKVILAGVGKSGIVARKIASTLTSIGNLAIYLHPCEALHGDFGIVTGEDVAIILSNSGETEELKEIMPFLSYRGVPIIAILGNLQSSLSQKANVVLDASVDCEACPLNLAPTTSTTVALAIGDALAMTLMKMRGVTSEDFAINHPAGRLGKRLTIRVGDLMHDNIKEFTIGPQASWLEVVSAISYGGLGAVNVVDAKGSLIGLITDGDLRRCLETQSSQPLNSLRAENFMTYNPVTVTSEVLAYDALKLMEERSSQISVLPVVDSQHYGIGLIRIHDIIRSGL